jgi:cytochrome P450/NADPH-cytochrome P450 reductase
MLDGNFDRLSREFPDFWKAFGNGMRGCIGRPFAWQEAILFMAIALQNFNFFPHDPRYSLQIKQTLTLKPKHFFMRAVLRDALTVGGLERRLTGGSGGESSVPARTGPTTAAQDGTAAKTHSDSTGPRGTKPLSIFFGSNTGTCESLAQRLAADAPAHGFRASVVDPLDAANENLPRDQATVVITASYEGQPPDNAGLFCGWIQNLKGRELEGVEYAVFGCGESSPS